MIVVAGLMLAVAVLLLVVEWWTARWLADPPAPTHSLDCLDGVRDGNCSHRSHFTREDIEFLDSLDGQVGFKP